MCRVCQHNQRAEIENALLELTDREKGVTVEGIAEEYGISVNELKLHALYHTPLVRPEDIETIEATQPNEADKFASGVLVEDIPQLTAPQPTRVCESRVLGDAESYGASDQQACTCEQHSRGRSRANCAGC